MSGRSGRGGSRSPRGTLLANLTQAAVVFALLAGELGPLTPSGAALESGTVDQDGLNRPEGGVVEAKPAPIKTPAGGGADAGDPSIGGEPIFLPYTPPAEVTELPGRRTSTTRTLANPDGSFTLEATDGPINYQDSAGNWQPIDLRLVPDEAGGLRVAANDASIRVNTPEGEIGAIEIDGHRVAISAPGYSSGDLGSDVGDLDANTVTFKDSLGTAADVWVHPIDIGLEFGASWKDPTASPVVSVVLDSGDLKPTVEKDGRSIVFLDAVGKFAGRIDQPIIREGSHDGAPHLDVVSVDLVPLPDATYLLSYVLDPKWLAAPERLFPVLLDPIWCIGQGASGCDDNYTSSVYNYDTFVFDASPNTSESGWTVLRVGYDDRTDDAGVYGKMRALVKFKHVGLPDGAVVRDTDLQLQVCCTYNGGFGNTIYAYRVTKFWSNPVTWNQIAGKFTTTGAASDTAPSSGFMNWDVDSIVQGWYTRTNKKRTDDFGFMLKMGTEASGTGEVEFRRYNDGTAANRPLLTIDFNQANVGIDFDPRLGPTYAPSSMVAGLQTKLPIVVENKAGSPFTLLKCTAGDNDCWKVGYSWFDAKGNLVAGGNASATMDLPANVSIGAKSAPFAMSVTPPSTVGQYTLRLDAVKYYFGTYAFASDFTQPTKFYSRNKKVLTADSTRWTGSSAIERDEFSINVTAGAGGSAVESVAVPSGGQLSLDLYSKNLAYSADTGLGFSDRLPLSLTYGYNEAIARLCQGYQGILASCGWYTNWDERIIGGANKTGFDYTYVGPDGTPYMMDTSSSGQLVGGAPVLINRQRVTILDENAGWDGGVDADADPDIASVDPGGETPSFAAFSGQRVGKVAANTSKGVAGPDIVTLNTYRRARFAMRTTASTGAASAGLCFKVHNITDSTNYPDKWFCYTVGTSWTTGFSQINLGLQAGVASLKGNWNYYDRDLYYDVATEGSFGGATDDYQIIALQIQSSSGSNSGYTYVDGFRFEAYDTVVLDDTNITWTTGSSTTVNGDAMAGTSSIKVTPAGLSPQCKVSACWAYAGGLWSNGFVDWYWKKAGGTSAAMVFWIHDRRTGAPCNAIDCTLMYYAGVAPTFTADAAIRISSNLPSTWTLVRRNLIDDARQALNLYDDDNTGLPDDLQLMGYSPAAVDGTSLQVDRLAYGGLPDIGAIDPTGLAGPSTHPSTVGDATLTYDYTADYADGSRHYFNRDGLLVLIRNRDRQAITLDWTYNVASSGPTAYTLTAIHAPGDATSSGGVTFDRQFTVTAGTDGSLNTLRFDEQLGSTGSDSSTRAAIFETASAQQGSQNGTLATAVDGVNNNKAWLGAIFYARPGSTVQITGTTGGQTGRSIGIVCPDGGPSSTFVANATTGPWNLTVPGTGMDGCHAYIETPGPIDATLANWIVTYYGPAGDLAKVSPARTPQAAGANGTFCGSRAPSGNGCVEFSYVTGSPSHLLQYVADPRWIGDTSGIYDYRLEIGRDVDTAPTSIMDRSHAGATLFNVLKWRDTQDASLLYNRPQWQDAAAAAVSAAVATDLNPDGSALTRYATRTCATACSMSTLPDYTTQAQYKAVEYLFDGLARVNSVKTYRCPSADETATTLGWGCSTGERISMTLSQANASAKVDNYSDPLTGGQLLWSASADQVFASLRDSGGTNADWYRTEYVYDGSGQVAETIEARELATSTYLDTVKGNGAWAYWRLNETSGSQMTDSSGAGRNGTYTVAPTLGGAGVLPRDPANKAPSFNGTTQYAKATHTQLGTPSFTSFTAEAWVKSTTTGSDQVWLSTRGTTDFSFDSTLNSASGTGGKGIRINVGNGTIWLLSTTVPFDWQANRWYQLAVSVDSGGNRATVYVDGSVLGAYQFTTNGTALFTNTNHSLFIGQTGIAGTPRWFAGQIDEVAVYGAVLKAADIAAHFRAGRAIATIDTTVVRDSAGRPTETAASFIANPGFEQASNGWTLGSGATISTADANSGVTSLSTSTTATTQIAQLVPGQSFRLQFATKGSASTSVTLKLEYANAAGAFSVLDSLDDPYSETSWTTRAFDVRLPITDADGRVRISLYKTGAGSGWADDVVLATRWAKIDYDQTAGLSLGLPTNRYGLATCPTGPCAAPTIRTGLVYAAGTTTPNFYPAIFPQKTVANWQNGTHDVGENADIDVVTQLNYDSWGRQVSSKDPDLVETETLYGSNQTDVGQTKDGLDHPTSMTYDKVGNVLTTTSPLLRVTASTYDFRNQRLTTADPAGIVSKTDYNNFGQATASWANSQDGTPANGDGTDDLLTVMTYDRFGRVRQQDAECGSVAACATGGLDARSETRFDLLGNAVTTKVYPGTGGTGTGRTTTNHFETFDPPSGSPYDLPGTAKYSRTTATGTLLAVPPDTSAPFCPGSTTVRCNSVTSVDLGGRAIGQTDAYGVVSRTSLDLDGHAVQTIANYVAGGNGADENVTTLVEYDVLGNAVVSTDPLNRYDVRGYDAVGRLKSVAHHDSAQNTYLTETTDYTPAGRVSRTFDGSAYTKTVYDGAGRAIRTVANDDATGFAGMTIDALESTPSGWSTAFTSGQAFVANSGATISTDGDAAGNVYDTVPAASGRGRLHVMTHASNANTGAWIDISGATYQATHAYKAMFDARASTAGNLTAYLGKDVTGASYGQQTISATTSWARYAVTWTPSTNLGPTEPIRFALVKPTGGTVQVYVDNLVIWDTTIDGSGKDWSQTGIVSTISAYNDDGEIAASVLPPGAPTTESPLVTSVAFDASGRGVVTTVNGSSGSYAASVLGTSTAPAAYVALDERIPFADATNNNAPSVADKRILGGNPMEVIGTPRLGVAGATDETRTAVATGTGSYLKRATNATASTTNVSMEAWIRRDGANPSQTLVVAANGTVANAWGIGLDTASKAAGFVISGSTLTTMSASSSSAINDGRWHHIVLTRNATTWSMTLDGIAPTTLTSSTANPGTPGAGFSIGALSDGSRAFAGEVDEVSVYAADISGSAVAHWQAGRQPSTNYTSALTSRTAYDRLGRATDVWAPDGVRSKALYDRLGRQVETYLNYIDGVSSGTNAQDDVRSTYAYDVLGELVAYCPAVQVQSAGGCAPATGSETKAWHYVFDDLGRQTKTIPPVNQTAATLVTSETVYEADGRIGQTCTYPAGTSCTATNGRHVDFVYDDLGRVLTQKTWDKSTGTDVLKFTKTLTWNKDGSPASASEGSTTLNYEYDAAGRPSAFKNGTTQLTAWTYTANTSTVATRTDGTGTPNTTSFTYDWARRSTSITPTAGTFASAGTVSRAYRLDGTLASQTFPSSITETMTYDAVKRPTGISMNTSVTSTISQTFDRAGRVTSDGRSLNGIGGDAGTGTQSFVYDYLSRLTSSTLSSATRNYTYDVDGNRLSRQEGGTTTTFSYDRTDIVINQVIGATTKTYSYDRFGNLGTAWDKNSASTTYAYDEANRLTGITPPTGGAIAFTVDPLDRHASRSVGGTVADNYGYVGPTETAWSTGLSATPTTSLVDVDGTRLAIKTGPAISWLVFDLHGSVVALCTAGGSGLSDAYRYDGYGQLLASSGASLNPYQYRGLLNIGSDNLTWALLDMGARDYAPQLGQFTQLDSVQGSAANPLAMNRYLYALANPATLIDPDGHFAMEWDPGDQDAPPGTCRAQGDQGCGRTVVATKERFIVNLNVPRQKGCSDCGQGTDDWTVGPTPLDTLPGATIDDRILHQNLATTCATADASAGGPCAKWQRLEAENDMAIKSFCRENRDYCVERAKQTAVGLGLITAGIAVPVLCVQYCPRAVTAVAGTLGALRDQLRPLFGPAGSTGRAEATNLLEQLAMQEVRSDPGGVGSQTTVVLRDARWLAQDGWVKMAKFFELSGGRTIEIHWNLNTITNSAEDFKFVISRT